MVLFYNNGIRKVTIKLIVLKYKISKSQQKQIHPQEAEEHLFYLLLVIAFILKQAPTIQAMNMFLLILKEQIISKLVIFVSNILDTQLMVSTNQWDASEINSYQVILGTHDRMYQTKIAIKIHQHNGLLSVQPLIRRNITIN